MPLLKKLKQNKWIVRLKDFAQNAHLSKKQNVPLYLYVKLLIKKIVQDNMNGKAMAVAFSLTLSIFPTILFFLSLLPYTPIDRGQILAFLANAIPSGIYGFIDSTINDILSNKRQDLLSFSVLFALYAATNGMAALISSFNRTYKYAEKRSFLRLRLVALLLTMVVGFVLLVAVTILIVGNFVFEWLSNEGFLTDNLVIWGIIILKYLVVFLVFFLAISFIYYMAPASKKKWRFFSLGSVTASILIILSTNGFSFYLDNFTNYNKLYGSIGTIIALMLWIYLLAFILLLGLEMNASWQEAKRMVEYNQSLQASEEIRRTDQEI